MWSLLEIQFQAPPQIDLQPRSQRGDNNRTNRNLEECKHTLNGVFKMGLDKSNTRPSPYIVINEFIAIKALSKVSICGSVATPVS